MKPCWHVVWINGIMQGKVDCNSGELVREVRRELENPVLYKGPHGLFLKKQDCRHIENGWERNR